MATLDTKGREASYLADIIEACGRKTILIDVGTGRDGGDKPADAKTPTELLKQIAERTRSKVGDLLGAGTISAIVGVAGGRASAVFGEVVSELPYGFPKFLVSSARPALLAELATHSDIILYPTLVDLFGINVFTSRVLKNAGRAIAATHYAPVKLGRDKKIVAITAFGVTTPAANQCVARLADAGVDAIVFPANGAGGHKMEQLIAAGEFDAVIDLTITELGDEIVGGTASAGPDRLKAASRQQIPQVIAPGAIDMVNFGLPSSVPDQFRGRQFYAHTPYTTLMRTTASENASIGRLTAERLSRAKGPTMVLWPAKGVSDYVVGGIEAWDPLRLDLDALLDKFWAAGFSGVINYPTISTMGDNWRDRRGRVGLGFEREVELIALARKKNIFSLAYVASPQDAKAMASAGADCIVPHVGATRGGLVGHEEGQSVKEAIRRINEINAAARSIRSDVLSLCHGGAIAEQDTIEVYRTTECVGFVGASSIERIPIERAVKTAAAEFKAVPLPQTH
ncbi:phosphoenolpyruvate hydrolase family protein [Bradyrhizobium japonicum]|uniref:phosphoenolpyruvate hydrolase family protein n=1 Tax=Bradyrhizobium japonicum TaxID=375 RepID=UPI00200EA3E8|nr:Tm-1-like ATP-binding domain-containing protein [Bradyrhizobium japonicum]WLB21006.1 Tm-1-like ATP-binding domain-containing protein [Bradyrhizobium japonicum]